jgi:hypothetical protein
MSKLNVMHTAVSVTAARPRTNGTMYRASTTALAAELLLSDFRATASRLTLDERRTLVEQALLLFEANYVHLPLKMSMHAANPVQRLRLLIDRLRYATATDLDDETDFHREMLSIFMSVRDLHTNYLLPVPYQEKVAFLPFLVEEFFEDGSPHYLVTRVRVGFTAAPFEPGVEIVRWNGVPIADAVMLNGNRFAGSNLEARRARGIETLTVRPLTTNLPPDENRVIIDYLTADGAEHELRVPWRVLQPAPNSDVTPTVGDADINWGVDVEVQLCREAKKHLFAPHVVEAEAQMAAAEAAMPTGLTSRLPSVIEARAVDTAAGRFGYVRLRTFAVNDTALLNEFSRLVDLLPDDGLIIDVRGNGGGLIWASERLLQLLTPQRIQPEPFQFRNTPRNLALCEMDSRLRQWAPSIRDAVRTQAVYSRGFPVTTEQQANDIGQRYHGPVVLVTDALCYSATDMFAAGFQDHAIGVILGVHRQTGAGGANVWRHTGFIPYGDPYTPLPRGSGMRVSIRRCLRVGDAAGAVVEDFGVSPDAYHPLTRADLLRSNVDLIERAAALLAGMPRRRLEVATRNRDDNTLALTVRTLGISRLDVYDRQRPLGSVDVEDGETELHVTATANIAVELRGFDNGALVAVRRLH